MRQLVSTLSLFSKKLLLLLLVAVVLTDVSLPVSVDAESENDVAPATGNPGDALRQAGISSFTKGALSNIVIRGYQRENLFITFDGAPYFGATPFRVDAPPFLLQNTDFTKIIVTKGPYNLTYPGGAGGSVEVRSPENPRQLALRSSLSYGSYDAVDGSAVMSAGNQQADLTVGYRGRSSGVPEGGDGIPFTNIAYPNPNNNYRPGSDDLAMYRIDTFWLKTGVNPTANARFELAYNFLQGADIKTPTLAFDVSDEQIHRLNGRLVVKQVSALMSEIALQGWWSKARTLIDDSLRETANAGNVVLPYRAFLTRPYSTASRFEVDTVGGRITANLALGPGLLKNGLDFYQRDWSGTYSSLLNAGGWRYLDNETVIPDVVTRNVGVYAIYETPLADTVRASVSARGDVSRIDADGLTSALGQFYRAYQAGRPVPGGRDFTDWSANAQLFWKVVPELELFLKGGRSNRLPDAHELYIRQVRQGSNLAGNPLLNQTVVNQVDIGANWAAGGHSAELTLFYSAAADFILPVYRPDPDGTGPLQQARSLDNIDATIWGAELDGVLQLPANLKLTAMIAYGEGYNRSSHRPLAEIPPLRGRLGLLYDDRQLFGGISQTLVAPQHRYDATLNETAMPGYGVTDLHVGARCKGFVVSVKLQNLFDIRYVQPLSYQRDPIGMGGRIPENGRNVMLTASYRF